MDFTFQNYLIGALQTFFTIYGLHILLAAWALSRLRKAGVSETARGIWTLVIVFGAYAGPAIYLLGSYRRAA